MNILKTDLLILGSGLAGLRAARSALVFSPDLDLTLVAVQTGASGASFTNPNGQLGMLVLDNDQAKEEFYHQALALAEPGLIIPALVKALAEESSGRFLDLLDLGLECKTDASRQIKLHPACFWPNSSQAAAFINLPKAFQKLWQPLKNKVCFLPDWKLKTLIIHPDKGCSGALLARDTGQTIAIRAKTTILAVGGPAPLFPWHLTGQGNLGYGIGLLKQTGVRMANQGFVQIMWSLLSNKTFFALDNLKEAKILQPDRGWQELPEELITLLPERLTHCPAAHGLPDSQLDLWLTACLDDQARITLKSPDGEIAHIVPCVQAGNGGALIDSQGQTSVPGLLACGECATGMHGANRIGGAMVSATQVFGHRSGLRAAQKAKGKGLLSENIFINLINSQDNLDPACLDQDNLNPRTKPLVSKSLACRLHANLLNLSPNALQDLVQELTTIQRLTKNWQEHLHYLSLQAIFQARADLATQGNSGNSPKLGREHRVHHQQDLYQTKQELQDADHPGQPTFPPGNQSKRAWAQDRAFRGHGQSIPKGVTQRRAPSPDPHQWQELSLRPD